MSDATDTNDDGTVGLSIGALSRASGVPVNTLRTWERRYGWPVAERTTGGQRVYAADIVAHVRLVVRALELGHRPGQVVGAPMGTLRDLVGDAGRGPAASGRVDEWIEAARRLDGVALEAGLRAELSRLGAVRFSNERLLPFLREMGDAWARGDMAVFQEHYASERVRDLLGRTVRELTDVASGSAVVCATLPGEHHALGLYVAALFAAVYGLRPVFLWADTPVEDIARAAAQSRAVAVVIALTSPVAPDVRRAQIVALRAAVPDAVEVVVGGAVAPDGIAGVTRLNDLAAFAEWASRRGV